MSKYFLDYSCKSTLFMGSIILFVFFFAITPTFGFDNGVFGEIRFDIDSYTLDISKSGTGGGTVSSSQVGINCGSDCTEIYDEDATVILTATPSTGSVFSGWSGDCSGSNQQTTLLLDSDKNCTATFSSIPPNIIYVNKADSTCGDNDPCYTSIQNAIDNAATGSVILVKQGIYEESLSLGSSKALLIKGGYNSTYNKQTANTTFIQAPGPTTIKASSGSLKFQMISVK